jgi:hypothetical protein
MSGRCCLFHAPSRKGRGSGRQVTQARWFEHNDICPLSLAGDNWFVHYRFVGVAGDDVLFREVGRESRPPVCQAKKTPSSSSPVKEDSESTVSSWISSLDLEGSGPSLCNGRATSAWAGSPIPRGQ